MYVSGTEKTAIVISDVTTLLLIILASCFVAAAPETADFPDIPRIALTIVCAVLYPIDFTIYVLSGIRLCVKVVLATCCANMCAKNDNPNTWIPASNAAPKASFVFPSFKYDNAKVAKNVIPNAYEQFTAPVTVSYVNDSIVPGLQRFRAWLYVIFPLFIYLDASLGFETPATLPSRIFFLNSFTASAYLSFGTSINIGIPSLLKYLNCSVALSKQALIHPLPEL